MRRVMMYVAIVCVAGAATASAKDAKDQGEKIFADQKCALCHSVDGKGNKKGSLDGVGSKLSSAEIHSWITDAKAMTTKTRATRKPAMKTYALPKDDVDVLVAYLFAMKKK